MTKIFVAGHNGMVGSSLVNLLKKNKKNKIITCSKKKLNLLNKKKKNNQNKILINKIKKHQYKSYQSYSF